MTEAEWLECAAPLPLLKHLRARADDWKPRWLGRLGFRPYRLSERKLRLFACACARAVYPLHRVAEGMQIGNTVEVAERFADGQVGEEELAATHDSVCAFVALAWDDDAHAIWVNGDDECAAYCAIRHATGRNVLLAAEQAAGLSAGACAGLSLRRRGVSLRSGRGAEEEAAERAAGAAESSRQVTWLRDIFYNPFRPLPSIDLHWLSWNDGTVAKIAQSIYDERRFADMPILADALEEAGCDNEDILAHSRQPGEHVRGCWVIDLLLAKE